MLAIQRFTRNQKAAVAFHIDTVDGRISPVCHCHHLAFLNPCQSVYIYEFRIELVTHCRTLCSSTESGDFDFVVIDTDSVFDNKKAKLLSMADKVIFVTNQNKMSVMATNVLAENINGINSEKYFYICNNFEENKENTLSMSEVPLRFSINEYIGHIEDYDKLKSSDFVNYTGFQKAAYLFI